MKRNFLFFSFVLIFAFGSCSEEETEDRVYSNTSGSTLFSSEHHRKSVYCHRSCMGHILVTENCKAEFPKHKYTTQGISCICSKSTKRIRDSHCFTEKNPPTAKSMKRRLATCSDNCKAQVGDQRIYAALCALKKPTPVDNLIRDCFCLAPKTKLQDTDEEELEDDGNNYEENDDTSTKTVNQCTIP